MEEAEAEFVELATAHGRALFRTALLLTGDRHAAEDLVQETFVKTYVHGARVQRSSDPAAYARTNLVRTFLSGRRRRSSGEQPRPDLGPGPADDEDHTLRLTLLAALARLEPQDRAVLVLRCWEDLDASATGALLGCTAAACGPAPDRGGARGGRPGVQREVSGGPGPSIIDLPSAGCWHLVLTRGDEPERRDTMTLRYVEPREPVRQD